MKERVFNTPGQLGETVAEEICLMLTGRPDALICIAAGHSSLPVFEALIKRKHDGFDFSMLRFVAMDEWEGQNANDEGSCGDFLKRNFLDPMGINRYFLFDGRNPAPGEECKAAVRYIEDSGGIDYLVLGVGMNGHLALNEPGCDPDGAAHFTILSDTTKQVGQKYFTDGAELTGGLTLGLRELTAARDIVTVVHGEHKMPIVKRLRAQAPSADFPASLLKNLEHARFYFDLSAYANE